MKKLSSIAVLLILVLALGACRNQDMDMLPSTVLPSAPSTSPDTRPAVPSTADTTPYTETTMPEFTDSDTLPQYTAE